MLAGVSNAQGRKFWSFLGSSSRGAQLLYNLDQNQYAPMGEGPPLPPSMQLWEGHKWIGEWRGDTCLVNQIGWINPGDPKENSQWAWQEQKMCVLPLVKMPEICCFSQFLLSSPLAGEKKEAAEWEFLDSPTPGIPLLNSGMCQFSSNSHIQADHGLVWLSSEAESSHMPPKHWSSVFLKSEIVNLRIKLLSLFLIV